MSVLESIENKLEKFQSKTIFSLLMIVFLGLIIRVYFTPWHLPTDSLDGFIFMIEGLAYSEGDLTNFSHRFLWPVFLSVFFGAFKFDDYFGYMTLVRILSIAVSLATIPIIYLVSKEFVERKYALIAATLFTLESNLIENSIFGQSESLFILFGLVSFYFILQKNYRYNLFAFIFAGLAFDTRINGIVLFLLVIISLLLKIRNQENSIKNLMLGVALFSLIVIPTHIIYPIIDEEREVFSFLETITTTIFESKIHYSTYETPDNISSEKIIFNAIKNEFSHIFRISIPYLIIFFPIGMIISIKNINFKEKMLFFVIIISLIIAIPQYTVSNEFRNLFFLTPFLCIFSAIGIQKLTEKIEIKNLFLILLVGGLILSSTNFLRERYNIDEIYFLEKDNFGKYIVNNFDGNITGNMRLEIIRNMPDLKAHSNFFNEKLAFFDPGITIDSISQLMNYAKENNIEYFVIEEHKIQNHFPIFNKILNDVNQYEYLKEILNSDKLDYKKFKVKIFKIDWNRYNEL